MLHLTLTCPALTDITSGSVYPSQISRTRRGSSWTNDKSATSCGPHRPGLIVSVTPNWTRTTPLSLQLVAFPPSPTHILNTRPSYDDPTLVEGNSTYCSDGMIHQPIVGNSMGCSFCCRQLSYSILNGDYSDLCPTH